MITVATTGTTQVEAMRFDGENFDELRKFVEFTGHSFHKGPNPFSTNDKRDIFYVTQAPGVILTVVRGEWLVYNLGDGKWRVYSDKEFQRQFNQE